MMMQFIENKNINKQKWDDCIDQSFNQSVSAYSWYLDSVFDNWSAIILDDYKAVFPLPIKSKFYIKYLFQPFFVRCIGIYSTQPLTSETVDLFFDSIPKSIKLFDFYLKENIPFDREECSVGERVFQMLELNHPYHEIEKKYTKSAVKNLRKAVRNELSIIDSVSIEEVAGTYKSNIGGKVSKLNDETFGKIESLMKAAMKNGMGLTIGIVNKEKVLIASAFFMLTKTTIFFSFGSANATGKSIGAMYLMVDAIIKKYAQQLDKLDFEGSDIKGIANFNRNFGAKDCVYLQVKKNTLPGIVKWISKKG